MIRYCFVFSKSLLREKKKIFITLGFFFCIAPYISGQLRIEDNSYRLGLLDTDESLLHGISGDHNGALILRTLSLYNGSLSQTANRILIGSGAPGAVDFSLMDYPSTLPGDTSLWLFNPNGSGGFINTNDISANGLFDSANEGRILGIQNMALKGETVINLRDNNFIFRGSQPQSFSNIAFINSDIVYEVEGAIPSMVLGLRFTKSFVDSYNGSGAIGFSLDEKFEISSFAPLRILSNLNTLIESPDTKIVGSSRLIIVPPNADVYLSNVINGSILLKVNPTGGVNSGGNEYSPYTLPIALPTDTSIWQFNPDGTGQYGSISDLTSGSGGGNGLFDVANEGGILGVQNFTLSGESTIDGESNEFGLTLDNVKVFNVNAKELGYPTTKVLHLRHNFSSIGVIDASNNFVGLRVDDEGQFQLGLIYGYDNGNHEQLIKGFGVPVHFSDDIAIKTRRVAIGEVMDVTNKALLGISFEGAIEYSDVDYPFANPTDTSIWLFNPDGSGEYKNTSELGATPTNGLTNLAGGIGLGGTLNQSTIIDGNNQFFLIQNIGAGGIIGPLGSELGFNAQGNIILKNGYNSGASMTIHGDQELVLSSTSSVRLISPEVRLQTTPPLTTTEDAILVRNATTGVIEQRDAATLTPDLITLFANLPIYTRTRDAGNDASLPSGSLFKVADGNDGTSTIHIKN